MLGQGLGLCIRASLLTAACRLVDHLHHDKYSYQLPVLAASFIVVKTFPLLAYRLVGFQCQKDFRGRAINSQQGGGRDSGSHAAGCWLLQVLAVSRGVRMALTAAFTCSQEQVTRRPRLSRLVAFVLEVVPRSATHGQKDQSLWNRAAAFYRAHPLWKPRVRAGVVMLSEAMSIQSFPNPAMVEDSGTAA